MADPQIPMQATSKEELERQIMSWSVPKNEREWWALHEIEALRAQLAEANAKQDSQAAALSLLLSCFNDEGGIEESHQDQLSVALETAEHALRCGPTITNPMKLSVIQKLALRNLLDCILADADGHRDAHPDETNCTICFIRRQARHSRDQNPQKAT